MSMILELRRPMKIMTTSQMERKCDAKDSEDVNKLMSEQDSGRSKAKLSSFEEITELTN